MTPALENIPRSPLTDWIGGSVDSWKENGVVTSVVLEDRHLNPAGVVHGGVVTTMMDEATGYSVVASRGAEASMAAPHFTVEVSVSLLSGARAGDRLVCEARTLRVGRAVAVAEAEVRIPGRDELVAKGRFTYAILVPRRE
jgi:uncharacterized protein (TIGR00369 family)